MEPATSGVTVLNKPLSDSVALRDPIDSDADVHLSWPPSEEIVRMYGGNIEEMPQPCAERSWQWLNWFRDHPFARIITTGEEPVGHVRLHSLDRGDQSARLAIGFVW